MQRYGAPPQPGTLGAWLLDATARLAAAGLPSPRADAQRLAAFGLGISWSDLWTRLGSPLPPEVLRGLDELAARRAAGEPLAWILGTAEFFGLTLQVGPGVLVPRPETEVVVEVALGLLEGARRPVVADVATGSGAIALAVARHRPDAEVHATDASEVALGYARRNAACLGVAVRLHLGDLLEALPPQLRGRLDLVVSNPPYVPLGDRDLLPPDVRREPPEALFAGPRGDELLLRLVEEAPGWLAPGGALVLEVGTPQQAETVLGAVEGWRDRGVEQDRSSRPRVVWARGPLRG